MPETGNYITPPNQSFAGLPVCTQLSNLKADIAIIGSARQQEVDDARAFGSVFIRAREVHRKGIGACIERIPKADHYLISIDSDAFDTAIAPGVLFHSPGGLTFDETADLVQGITLKGPIAGINLFEVRPELDINGLTALTGAQLIINFIGTLAHSGQIGR
jgi:agmatinase